MFDDEDAVYALYEEFKKELWTWMDQTQEHLPTELGATFVATAGMHALRCGLGVPKEVLQRALDSFDNVEEDLENAPTTGSIN